MRKAYKISEIAEIARCLKICSKRQGCKDCSYKKKDMSSCMEHAMEDAAEALIQYVNLSPEDTNLDIAAYYAALSDNLKDKLNELIEHVGYSPEQCGREK